MFEITDDMVERYAQHINDAYDRPMSTERARGVLANIIYPPITGEGWVFYIPEQKFYYHQGGRQLFTHKESGLTTIGDINSMGRENFRVVRIED